MKQLAVMTSEYFHLCFLIYLKFLHYNSITMVNNQSEKFLKCNHWVFKRRSLRSSMLETRVKGQKLEQKNSYNITIYKDFRNASSGTGDPDQKYISYNSMMSQLLCLWSNYSPIASRQTARCRKSRVSFCLTPLAVEETLLRISNPSPGILLTQISLQHHT